MKQKPAGRSQRNSVERNSKLFFDNKISENDIWLDSKEAAEFLRISTRTLMNICSSGEIIYYKFGRRNRYKLADLKSLLLKERRGFYGN